MKWRIIVTVTCLVTIPTLTIALTKNDNFLSSQVTLAQQQWQSYQNSRFGFKLKYPKTWDEPQESQRGDGAVLLDTPRGSIRVYANLVTQQTKTPKEWSGVSSYETLTLPSGQQGLFVVNEQGKETKVWFFVHSGDKYYNLRAEGSSAFINQHLDKLRQVAQNLTITKGEDGLSSSASDTKLDSLQVSQDEIRAKKGAHLLHIDDLPNQIAVDDNIQFGAATRFKEASLAPDKQWFAVTTASASHDAAWLVKVGKQQPYPVAFQFEGSIKIGPWSDNSQYVALMGKPPAPQQLISIANRKTVGATLADSEVLSVRLPQHKDRVPVQTTYQPVKWRNGKLVFEVNGKHYLFDPKTEQVQAIR